MMCRWMSVSLRQAVADASRPEVSPQVIQTIRAIYDALAADTAAQKPRCDASGRCCNFDAFGHRLYVTTMELAAFVDQLPASPPRQPPTPTRLRLLNLPRACPYQVDRLCSVHAIRPFGCRVFFCDPTATAWQHDRYEYYHAQLRAAHARLDIAYFYLEWRQALNDLGLK